MPRVLVCLDEVPAQDGSCAVQAWQEVPAAQPLLPELTAAQVQELSGPIAVLFAVAWCWKKIGRQL